MTDFWTRLRSLQRFHYMKHNVGLEPMRIPLESEDGDKGYRRTMSGRISA